MKIDLNTIQIEIENGNVRAYKHPTLPITGYNYTPNCSFKKAYNETNSRCRGLVVGPNSSIVCYPMGKFYNYEEENAPKNFLVQDIADAHIKEDGSCIFLFYYEGEWITSTRGSFSSQQALAAKGLIETKYNQDAWTQEKSSRTGLPLTQDKNNFDLTFIFELVGPDNINVTRAYKDNELRLLAIMTNYGIDAPSHIVDTYAQQYGFKRPERIYIHDWNEIFNWVKDNPDPNFEGIVVRLHNGTRFKVKSHLYCQLHKALTGTWTRARILEWWLSAQKDTLEIDPLIPDEFYDDIRNRIQECETEWQTLWSYVQAKRLEMIELNWSRKDFAIKMPEVQALLTTYFSHKDDLNAWKAMAQSIFVKQYV